MAQQQQGIALNAASQGGIIDDIDVEVLDAAFCEWDYQGSLDHNILALGIQYGDADGKTYDQYYSAGELTYFVPSDDGSMAVPVADKQQLTDSCNAWKFLASLLECDNRMDAILATGNVKNLVGLKCHVKQHAQPKRQGLIRGGKNPDREPTVLLVSQIHSLPGEQAAPAPKKAGIAGGGKPVTGRPAPAAAQAPAKPGLGSKGAPSAAAPAGTGTSTGLGGVKKGTAPGAQTSPSKTKANGGAGAPTPVADEDDKVLAAMMLDTILNANNGQVTKKDLAKLAFQTATAMVSEGQLDAKAKTRIVQLVFQDSFLHELAGEGGVVFDGATVSLPS